jgi:hypothetical protein
MTRLELLSIVERVFPEVPFPASYSLRQARLADDWTSDPHAHAAARDQDLHGHWSFTPDSEIRSFADAFAFLEADGVIYYLPAFMSYCLKHEQTSSHVVSGLIFHLSQNNPLSVGGKLCMLTENQRAAVAAFFEWCAEYCATEADRNAAKSAFQTHWKPFKDWSL